MDNLDALEAMARAAMHDDRLSDGALYGKLADAITELRAELAEAQDSMVFYMDESDAYCKARQELRSRLEAAEKDRERLDWIEQQHTLHKAVEFLYVVDGYQAEFTYDDNPVAGPYHGETLRAAIDAAFAERSVDRGTTRSTKEPVK